MRLIIAAAIFLLPSIALAQAPSHQELEQQYAKCLPHRHVPPGTAGQTATPTWDNGFEKSCPTIESAWKAHREELNGAKTKDDLNSFADRLKR